MSKMKMSNEERRNSKLEEALEVKSLRRIISAYLNYSDAAEEDVKRYERSFKKLPPAHKALLSHLPLKFQRLRRCISINSFFILNMLQAFEPPLDMSQDIDICEHEDPESAPEYQLHSGERNFCSCQSVSTSGRMSSSKTDLTSPDCGRDLTCISLKGKSNNEEVRMESVSEPVNESQPVNSEDSKVSSRVHDDARIVNNQMELYPTSDSNGNASAPPRDWLDPSLQLNVPLVDVDKVRCIVRNIVRDWAPEGRRERDQCYKPILEELDRLFPSRFKDRPPSCLVPGAGLGRLALEISCMGFISQGNEFSYYMMICSSFMLNHTQNAGEWTIYPWIHSNCNSLSDNDQLRPVSFPDIHPASAGITEGFSMCGGDFVEVYSDSSQEGVWDAVVTCFFLDTAHNIVEYIEIISRILKDGGVWINLGPLLYHFADAYGPDDEMSIEISLEDVKRVAFHYGFQLEREKTIETTYTANSRSMMQNRYYAAFWTMTKKEAISKKRETI
ncbi:PREDICTED: carnosine N-methyltransferase-like isoform X2 [Nelumbo nucifera]|uniref:carnosine N-methyltransferase n=1 Tax=Nelumbo nucifera TaxID=4432 RepID=A0A1U7ZCC0_NELNU|nr:PREDICTED: carnosine N-methyltransferase-like isoform X2 [Nelumbo nucifera]